MINFTPTKSQLKLLAKVANYTYFLNILNGKEYYDNLNESTTIEYKEWQPHKDRDQVAMILKGMSPEQKAFYVCKMNDYWLDSLNKTIHDAVEIWMQTVDPSISCEQILKVLETT